MRFTSRSLRQWPNSLRRRSTQQPRSSAPKRSRRWSSTLRRSSPRLYGSGASAPPTQTRTKRRVDSQKRTQRVVKGSPVRIWASALLAKAEQGPFGPSVFLALVGAAVAETGAVKATIERLGELADLVELGKHPKGVSQSGLAEGESSVAVSRPE
jgi:hypothetical protein